MCVCCLFCAYCAEWAAALNQLQPNRSIHAPHTRQAVVVTPNQLQHDLSTQALYKKADQGCPFWSLSHSRRAVVVLPISFSMISPHRRSIRKLIRAVFSGH